MCIAKMDMAEPPLWLRPILRKTAKPRKKQRCLLKQNARLYTLKKSSAKRFEILAKNNYGIFTYHPCIYRWYSHLSCPLHASFGAWIFGIHQRRFGTGFARPAEVKISAKENFFERTLVR